MERVNTPPNAPAPPYLGSNVKPLSFWWPVGLGIVWVVLFIIGGGLYGGFNTCWAKRYTTWSECVGLRQGCYAMIGIASIIFVAWVVVLVFYIVRRKKNVYGDGPTVIMEGRNFQNQPVVEGVKRPTYNNVGEFCGSCGTRVTSGFCTGCGAPSRGT